MIGFLRGTVVELNEEGAIVDVAGVGYELNCSSNSLSALALREEVQLFVHTVVREDAITLFAFTTQQEKRMFLSLLKVTGVGPKLAIKILSGASLKQLGQMIEAGDVKALSGLPKVGKKTAEQLILSLKGKLVLASENDSQLAIATSEQLRFTQRRGQAAMRFTGTRAEILSALINLGFRFPDAEQVVAQLPEGVAFETGLRDGLQALSGGF